MAVKENIKSEILLEKGIEILWSKGYNGTSVNDIVKAADVPKGSFYFYFDSKEDFVVKALQKYFVRMFARSKIILNDTSISPKGRLINFYEFRIKTLKEDLKLEKGCMACNLGNEVGEHNENIRKAVLNIHNKSVQSIVKVAKEAQQTGEIDASINVKDFIEFIEDAGKGAMVSMKEMKSAYPIDNFLKMVTEVLLK
ncbi:MAG: TetR/AcrR family transcriptional repressor of nem operon [Polaribacter sp.]|jgi:TetR/AcrR family transcriptional repressor of nem operon